MRLPVCAVTAFCFTQYKLRTYNFTHYRVIRLIELVVGKGAVTLNIETLSTSYCGKLRYQLVISELHYALVILLECLLYVQAVNIVYVCVTGDVNVDILDSQCGGVYSYKSHEAVVGGVERGETKCYVFGAVNSHRVFYKKFVEVRSHGGERSHKWLKTYHYAVIVYVNFTEQFFHVRVHPLVAKYGFINTLVALTAHYLFAVLGGLTVVLRHGLLLHGYKQSLLATKDGCV